MILGVVFLGLGLFLVLTPCIGVVAIAFGSMARPTDAHDYLATLCMVGICMALGAALLAVGVLAMHATLLPKTLAITAEGIELRWFKKRLGKIPFANMKDVYVKTRAMAGQTAGRAFWQGFLAGGLIGGLAAQSRFDPNESIGFIIKLADSSDPDTSWPKGFFQKELKKRLEVNHYWVMSHRQLVERIADAVARHKQAIGLRRGNGL
jgi:hypothetical protein